LSDVVEKGLRKMGVTVSKPILAAITLVFWANNHLLAAVAKSNCGHILDHPRNSAAYGVL
jgi:hypothetical protein